MSLQIFTYRSLLCLSTALTLSLATTGCFSSVRYDRAPDPNPPSLGVSVSVIAAEPEPGMSQVEAYELETLAELLRKTGVFEEVYLGENPQADLLAVADWPAPGWACGNPMMLTIFTLGLLSTSLPLTSTPYHFELHARTASLSSNNPSSKRPGSDEESVATKPDGRFGTEGLLFSQSEFGEYLFGAKALPLRVTPQWRADRDTPEDMEAPAIGVLQGELLDRRQDILRLAPERPSVDGPKGQS